MGHSKPRNGVGANGQLAQAFEHLHEGHEVEPEFGRCPREPATRLATPVATRGNRRISGRLSAQA